MLLVGAKQYFQLVLATHLCVAAVWGQGYFNKVCLHGELGLVKVLATKYQHACVPYCVYKNVNKLVHCNHNLPRNPLLLFQYLYFKFLNYQMVAIELLNLQSIYNQSYTLLANLLFIPSLFTLYFILYFILLAHCPLTVFHLKAIASFFFSLFILLSAIKAYYEFYIVLKFDCCHYCCSILFECYLYFSYQFKFCGWAALLLKMLDSVHIFDSKLKKGLNFFIYTFFFYVNPKWPACSTQLSIDRICCVS